MHFICIKTLIFLFLCWLSVCYECSVITVGGKPRQTLSNDYDNQPEFLGELRIPFDSHQPHHLVSSDGPQDMANNFDADANFDSESNSDRFKFNDQDKLPDPDHSFIDHVKESQFNYVWSSLKPKIQANIISSSSSQTLPSSNPSSSSPSSIILPHLMPLIHQQNPDLVPKSSNIQSMFASSSLPTEFMLFSPPPTNSVHHEENKSIDYATSLIKELLKSTWSFEWPFKESNSENSDEKSKLFPQLSESQINTDNDQENPLHVHEDDSGPPFDGEEQLLGEVEKLIGYIRKSEATEDSETTYEEDEGSSDQGEENIHKSRNNRNRLTHQMDYVEQLLNEYRSKQGVINLRHWARGVSTPRLSVTSPIAVLRDALMEEIRRKRIKEQQERIKENQKILEEIG